MKGETQDKLFTKNFNFFSTQMRWTDAHDVLFVREVLLFEPYQHRKGSVERKQVWEQLAVSLNANIDPIFRVNARSVRDHLNTILEKFKRKMNAEERASGINPDETELDIALRDILERFKQAEEEQTKESDEKKAKTEGDMQKAAEMRQRSLETFSETKERSLEETPSKRARNNGSETIAFLKEKAAMEMELKKEEMKQNARLKEEELKVKQALMAQQTAMFQQQQDAIMKLIDKLASK